MADPIEVHLACNEPSNGTFAGRVWAAEFHCLDHSVSIAGGFEPDDGLSLVLRPGQLVIDGEIFAHHGHQQWIGNWCWDRFELSLQEARKLMRRLLLSRWALEEWDDGGPFAAVIAEYRIAENARAVVGGRDRG